MLVDAQPAQGVLDGRPDVLGAAVQAGGAAAVEGEPELGGDHHLVADRRQGLADELLVGERAVHLGGVEEGDAEVDGGADEGDAVLLADGGAVGVAESHAAEADRGYLESAGAEGALDHCSAPYRSWAYSVCRVREACGDPFSKLERGRAMKQALPVHTRAAHADESSISG